MNKNSLVLWLFLGIIFWGCTSKNVKIAFSQKECKNLKLSNASYSIEKSKCNGNSKGEITNTVRLHVEHNGKPSCLEFFKIVATFQRSNGSYISGVSYKDSYVPSDQEVTLTDKYIEIAFKYTMPDQNSADELNTIKIDLRLENELKDVSKFFTLTIPLSCSSSTANGYTFQTVQDVQVNSSTVTLQFRDYSSIDGDIIAVYLNGTLVKDNMLLDGSFSSNTYVIQVSPGSNQLQVIALNEGSSSPNTCEVLVNGNTSVDLTPGLSSGQAINIVF
ncbi:MAG: hypothetical protein U0V72_00375 [Cytophagales bacterium]